MTRSGGMATFRPDLMRDHRQRAGLSLEQLAVLADISPETARRVEAGACRPTARVAVALAQALQVEMDILAPSPPGPETLKHLRQRTGKTQRQVADEVGMSAQMVSRVESGVYRVREPGRWAPAYGVTPQQWLTAWQAGRDERRRRIEEVRGGTQE
ncbi:helix-turn-helix transcriptional regulator [Streptomyces sp. NPDC053048]|uniref:helix-turn-helix transcriptional regulator n=1 Tax=Streptomyces sp. NPDC053048 TaxID=3365694 RepID=UPI0037D333E8